MKKEEIIELIKKEGEIGATDNERYVDISDRIIEDGLLLAQLIVDEDGKFIAYFIDEDDDGHQFEYDELSEDLKEKIEGLNIWNRNVSGERKKVVYDVLVEIAKENLSLDYEEAGQFALTIMSDVIDGIEATADWSTLEDGECCFDDIKIAYNRVVYDMVVNKK